MTKNMDLSVQCNTGGGIDCPNCGAFGAGVIDSRPAILGGTISAIRRRRQCEPCGHRFTTYEMHAEIMKRVDAASNGRRIPSRREIIRACIAQLEGML